MLHMLSRVKKNTHDENFSAVGDAHPLVGSLGYVPSWQPGESQHIQASMWG